MTTTARRRYVLRVMLAAVAGMALVVLLASVPRPPLVETIPGPPEPIPTSRESATQEPQPVDPFQDVVDPEQVLEMPGWIPQLVRTVVILAIAAALAYLIWRVWRTRVSTAREKAGDPSGEGVEIAEIDEEELAEAVEETMASLRRGTDVGGAIVECWRRLERLAADTGITRRPSQTSEEFTVDVLSRGSIDEAAIGELGSLYRQAMFSTHQLSDDDRDRAIACLEALSSQLRVTP